MNRLQTSLLMVALALSVAAYGAFSPKGGSCFADGSATYRMAAASDAADFRVRIDGETSRPDLRMRLVDRADAADFVLVDDFSAPSGNACRSSGRTKTVTLDADTPKPDVTVRLFSGEGPADYSLYVHSVRFSQSDAAALLAAMWKAGHRRELVSRVDR